MTSTFVTVVFEPELPLLDLQAKSMARFLDPPYAERIIVLDNSESGIPKRAWTRIRHSYGSLTDRAEVVRGSALARTPSASGWFSQQVLKLAVAGIVDTSTYVTLDAKNHFIRPAGAADFEAADGRPFGNFHGYETHPHRGSLERVLAYTGLDAGRYVARFGATATPFTLLTDRVTAMVTDVERTSGRTFSSEFIRAGLTEYFLYTAWLIAQGEDPENLYDAAGIPCAAVWPRGATVSGVTRALADVQTIDPALFAVHRSALARMDAGATSLLADLWVARGLFASATEARGFVWSYRARYFPAVALKRVKDRLRHGPVTA